MNKNNFLVNPIISADVRKVEKINLEQFLEGQLLYINEINIKVN